MRGLVPEARLPVTLRLALPDWLVTLLAQPPPALASAEARMDFVLALARRNVASGTGGPFAAAVFERSSGRLVAAAVNLVVAGRCSPAHAEIVALALAQQAAGTHDLGAPGLPAMALAASTEPCAMCLGAIPWSGVRSLLCGARGADAEAIGFDEGDKPADWPARLAARGITVHRDIRRDAAAAILRDYAAAGGPVYNPRRGAVGNR